MAINIDPRKKQIESAITMEIDVSLLQLIQVFKHRKMVAKALHFKRLLSPEEKKTLEDQFDYLNSQIKNALGL